MSYGWGGNPPTSIWESLGRNLSRIGQGAADWIPAIQNMAHQRNQGAYNQLQLVLQMPGVTPEQKQAAIQKFQDTINQGGGWDAAWKGFNWPTQMRTDPASQPPFMGPATPPVAGPQPGGGPFVNPDPTTGKYPSTVPSTPGAALPPGAPAPADINAPPSVPGPTATPPPPAPSPAPGTSPTAPAPYTRGTTKTEFLLPTTPLGSQTLETRYASQPNIINALRDAGIPTDQPIEEVNQLYPHWTSIVRMSGTGVGTRRTWGQFFPYLNAKHPDLAGQPMPAGYVDPKTGEPSAAAEAWLRANGYQPPSEYQVETGKDRKSRSFESAVTAAQEHIRTLDTAITRGHPGQIHALVKERDDYVNAQTARLKKMATALKEQGIDVSFEGLEYTRYSPQDLESVTAGERGKAAQKTFATERAQAIMTLRTLRTEAYRQLRARNTGGAATAIRQYNQALQAANARLGPLAQAAGIDTAVLEGFEPMSDQNLGTMIPPSRTGGGAGRRSGTTTRPPKAWNQSKYDAAITTLRGERLRFGRDPATGTIKDPIQLNLAVDRFKARATALGMNPADAQREAQAAVPEWQPSSTPADGAGAGRSQQPGASGSGTLSPKGQQAYTAYQQANGRPIPQLLWSQIPKPDQDLLTRMGVTHE